MKITRHIPIAVGIFFTIASSLFAGEAGWSTNYTKALEQAKAQNKPVLLDFTGSDWCGWCMKMKKETLDKPEFKKYAQQNLVLVEVDFPQMKQQPATVKSQNQKLKQEFKVNGYPCFVLVDKEGKELGRQGGYLEGGPAAFIAKLNTFYTPAPTASARTGNGSSSFDEFFKKPAASPAP